MLPDQRKYTFPESGPGGSARQRGGALTKILDRNGMTMNYDIFITGDTSPYTGIRDL
jgi:hypothetical protein